MKQIYGDAGVRDGRHCCAVL